MFWFDYYICIRLEVVVSVTWVRLIISYHIINIFVKRHRQSYRGADHIHDGLSTRLSLV